MLLLLLRNHSREFASGAVLEDTRKESVVQEERTLAHHNARNLMASVTIVENMDTRRLIVISFKRKDRL